MLARHGAGATVTLLSDEPDAPYDRTFCSKQYLAGKAERNDTILPPPGEGVTVRTGVAVTRIDRDAGAVVLGDGERVAYDILVLATGSAAVPPDFYGANRDDVHVVRGLADADRLIAALAGAARDRHRIELCRAGSCRLAGRARAGGGGGVRRRPAAGKDRRAGSRRDDPRSPPVQGRDLPLQPPRRALGRACRNARRRQPGRGRSAGRRCWCHAPNRAGRGGRADARRQGSGGGVQVDACLRTSDPAIHAIGDIASVPDPGWAIRSASSIGWSHSAWANGSPGI
jgi:NADPH-dependent 2,4-dienoyl-CoA reductase/sulfur reductase-like enzyme